MKPNLKLWVWKDYQIPKSQGAQHITILVLTILIAAVTLAELTVDLAATNIELMAGLFVVNLCLLLLSYRKVLLKWIGLMQVVVLYLLFELHFVLLPESFHIINYWMPCVPLIALIFRGLRFAHIWLAIILATLFANSFYGMYTIGDMYSTNVFYKSYLVGGSIFNLMIVSCFSILYNLLGRAYHKIRLKNAEVIRLMDTLQELNETLEIKVASRTKNIEKQNDKLREYAFMNSHLVRAPLANILGAIEHLEETKDISQIHKMSSIIKKSADDLDLVIKDVGKSLVEIKV